MTDQLRQLIIARDDSHEDSIRIALKAAGIEGLFAAHRFGIGGVDAGKTVVMVRNHDYKRAEAAIAHLQQTPPESIANTLPMRIIRWAAVLVLILVLAVRLLRMIGR